MTPNQVATSSFVPTRAIWAIVLAAGQSTRLRQGGLHTKKQFLIWQGVPLFWHSVRVLARTPSLQGVVVVLPPDEISNAGQLLENLVAREPLGIAVRSVAGGELRQDSVRNALEAIPRDCPLVLVHDAARPFVRPQLVQALLDVMDPAIAGAIPGLALTDTIKEVAHGVVQTTLDRARLQAVQTPQLFVRDILEQAHQQCARENWTVTDDASLLERIGAAVRVVPGDVDNIKITMEHDLERLRDVNMNFPVPCVGLGYDVHRFGPGRTLKLGGIPFPGGPEIVAHSDGDVLLHALADALLGCLGRGDIGELFPDTDARFEGIDSAILVSEVMELVHQAKMIVTHVDMNIIAQVPKIAPRREEIRRNVARLMQLEFDQVSIKAGTEEKLGFTGSKQGIKAMAVVTALKKARPSMPPDMDQHLLQ